IIDLCVGHIMHNDHIMAMSKLHSMLEKAAVGAGRGGIIGVVEPEQACLCQYVLWNSVQVWKIVVLFKKRQHVWNRADCRASSNVDRIVRIGYQRHITSIENR